LIVGRICHPPPWQFANGGQVLLDGRGTVAALFLPSAMRLHHGPIERRFFHAPPGLAMKSSIAFP
jgi:hypothetical protein